MKLCEEPLTPWSCWSYWSLIGCPKSLWKICDLRDAFFPSLICRGESLQIFIEDRKRIVETSQLFAWEEKPIYISMSLALSASGIDMLYPTKSCIPSFSPLLSSQQYSHHDNTPFRPLRCRAGHCRWPPACISCMGLYNWIRFPHNLDCNQANGRYTAEIWIFEA